MRGSSQHTGMTATWLLPPPATPPVGEAGQYFRETFPYSLPPLTRFEREAVPLDPAPAIWITDTTFRDGQQSRAPYTPEQFFFFQAEDGIRDLYVTGVQTCAIPI